MKKVGKKAKILTLTVVCVVLVAALLGGSLYLASMYGLGPLNRHDKVAYAEDRPLLAFREPFEADYIWIKENGVAVWAAFAKEVTLDCDEDYAVFDIACDTYYWLWVNGEEIVWEGGLKRGVTPTDGFYDRVEIKNKFKKGVNTVAVLVRHLGDDGFSHKDSGRGGLVIEGSIGTRPFVTDGSWKARRFAYRYGALDFLGNLNFRLSERGSRVDGERYVAFWREGVAADWDNAVVLDRDECRVAFGRSYLNPLPPKKAGETIYFDSDAYGVRLSKRTKFVFHLPVNAQFCPYFEFEADKKGRKITYYTENKSLDYVNTYTAKAGANAFLDFAWINGETLYLEVDAGVTLRRVGYRPTGYGADRVGEFRSEDEALNALWQKAANTLEVTMRDSYMDCPDRERAQWIGDAVVESGMSFYALTPASAALFRKAIVTTYGWVHADGTIQSVVPDGVNAYELPMQNLAFLVGCVDYVAYSGDTSVVDMILSMAEEYLPLWEMRGGLVVHRKGSWDWGDWGSHIDMPALENAWYYYAMARLVTLAKEGSALRELCEERMAAIATAYTAFWTDDGIAGGKRADDRANAVAVLAGLYRMEDAAAFARTLYDVRNASPYMEKYVEEALCVLGRTDLALARAKERYADMIADECSTLWEFWDKRRGTTNHAWAGGTLTVLARYVGGVYPTAEGFSSFVVAPDTQIGDFELFVNPVAGVEIGVKAQKQADGRRRVVVTCSSEGGRLVVTGKRCVYNGAAVPSDERAAYAFDLAAGANVLVFEE